MGKLLKKLRTIGLILGLSECLFFIAFIILYFNNVFQLESKLNVEIVLLVCSSIAILDCLFIWVSFFLLYLRRQKNDLTAADVLGSDMQAAYDFAQIGLAITNSENIVLWTNDLFKDRHIEIIDNNILEWQPDLNIFLDPNKDETAIKITVNNRIYEVKNILDAGLWIFKDVTDYETVYKFAKDESLVIGLLNLDNYVDFVRDEDDINDTIGKIKTLIINYAKDHDVLLKRIKEDNYLMICNYQSYLEILNDNFSIVDKVRTACKDEVPLTISLSFAYDFPDVNKLHELANSALDIAMSRGGDQVVVSPYGKEMEFYGGKTEAQEKRNRVKTRVLADSLFNVISNSGNILIMGHTNMDMDAFGACLGIKAICDRFNKASKIVVDLKNCESKTRNCIAANFSKEEIDKAFTSIKESSNLVKANTLLIVVDVHIPTMVMAPKLLEEVGKIVVIDHHRRAEEYIDSNSLVFNHIDSSSSSTCELISEFIKYSSIVPKVELPATYASIMLSGIFLDSSYFKSRNTGIRTFEASSILKEYGADNSFADDLLKDDYEEHKAINDIISNIVTPNYGITIAVASDEKVYSTTTIAKAANTCMSFKGSRAAFAIAKIANNDIRISARSDGSINVQLLLEKIGGGGHFTSAAAAFEKESINEVKEMLLTVIKKNLKNATSNKNILEGGEE